jgi:hypothetical protein
MGILFNSKRGLAGSPTNAALARRRYHYVLQLYISVQLIRVIVLKHSHHSNLEFDGRVFATNVAYYF